MRSRSTPAKQTQPEASDTNDGGWPAFRSRPPAVALLVISAYALEADGLECRVCRTGRLGQGVAYQLVDHRIIGRLVVFNDVRRALVLDGDIGDLPGGAAEVLAVVRDDHLVMGGGNDRVGGAGDSIADGVELLHEG